MSDIDAAALRAAAEHATLPITCGGHRTMGSLVRCEECKSRVDARDDLSVATSPAVVLELLDRLAAAEGAVARVRALADLYDSWTGALHQPGSSSREQREQLHTAIEGRDYREGQP